jgi:hypothetical protein
VKKAKDCKYTCDGCSDSFDRDRVLEMPAEEGGLIFLCETCEGKKTSLNIWQEDHGFFVGSCIKLVYEKNKGLKYIACAANNARSDYGVVDEVKDKDIFVVALFSNNKANDTQIDGNHYTKQSMQPWDYITAHNMTFLEGNIIKYVSRYKDKNGVKDLEKARHYLDKLIEVTNAK